MAKLVVVENDKVEGTDKHKVAGNGTNTAAPPPTIPGAWIADFDYVGKMTGGLSDFVKVDGSPVALVTSRSALDPGENAPPAGRHSGPKGSGFVPMPPVPALGPPVLPSLSITDPVGTGDPNAGAGSAFVNVGGDAVLLDGDAIDTCDGLGVPANSTVTAENQDFVSCSE